MNTFERKLWRGFFLVATAILFPFSVALSIVAVLFTWGAVKLWRLVSRLARFGGMNS